MATAAVAIPSHERPEPGSVNIPIGAYPGTAISKDVDAGAVAEKIVHSFNSALSQKDYDAIVNLFLKDSYFRDHLALTWKLRTVKGPENILDYLKTARNPLTKIQIDKSSAFRSPTNGPIDAWGDVHGIQFFITFETEIGEGLGTVRLAETKEGEWKIFTFAATLRELKASPEPVNHRRTKGVEHGGNPERKTWLETREAEKEFVGTDPTVLIIGRPFLFKVSIIQDSRLTRSRRWTSRSHSRRPFEDGRHQCPRHRQERPRR